MKRTNLKRVSKKRAKQLIEEGILRVALLAQCKGLCMECGNKPDWRGLSLHHDKFKSHGGTNDTDNIRLLCGRCHSVEHGVNEV